jgi:hypothetical protein
VLNGRKKLFHVLPGALSKFPELKTLTKEGTLDEDAFSFRMSVLFRHVNPGKSACAFRAEATALECGLWL